ncbi:MAG: DUF1294 domain-containing protein [Planctomycetes bacterium]|nr:DUF1294 domain-containing protein [Planctomycetota bacterium]
MSDGGPATVRRAPAVRGTTAAVLTLVAAVAAWLALSRPREALGIAGAWLLATNVVAFLLFAIDKQRARRERSRIPERVLLGEVLVGGTVGGLVAMLAFRHKTASGRFLAGFALIALAQVALAAWLWIRSH